MKYLATLPILAMLALPFTASAHAHYEFMIGDERYSVVIGSLNEPITVDDKTGVDFRISKMSGRAMSHGDHGAEEASAPVTGLEETLKVELIAGDKKMVTDLSPAYGQPGAYKNVFYPTVATQLSYRIFGTIDGTPFDYTFSCNPAGHAIAEDDASEVKVSDGVMRTLQSGSYGCPTAKEALGFPEHSASITSLNSWVADAAADAKNFSYLGLGLSALALALAGYAIWGRRSGPMA